MSGNWAKGSIASAVQHAYVNCRLRDINGPQRNRHMTEALRVLEAELPTLRRGKPARPDGSGGKRDAEADPAILDAYGALQRGLQAAELTINFKSRSWFMTENHYPSYATMYERGMGADGSFTLTDADSANPARMRAAADDKLTFPSNWVQVDTKLGDITAGRGADRYDMKVQPGARPARGLAPGARGMGDVAAKMTTGKLTQTAFGKGAGAHYTPQNPHFDPKTKQVFAALNYGRRPHGSSTFYGHSYLVLDHKFKTNAMYYIGDTFGVFLENSRLSGNDQVGYDLLGTLVAKTSGLRRKALIDSCYRNMRLPDTDDMGMLLEAHLFEPLLFTGNVREVHVSATTADGPLTGAEWQTIQTNARKWARKHGARLFFID